MRHHAATAVAVAVLSCALAAGCGDDNGGEDGFAQAPIVFLHGCPPPPIDNATAAGFWTGETQGMPGTTDFYAERGYPDDYLNVFLYDGPTCPPNRDYAAQIVDYVEEVVARTGEPRVDILADSMGAVAGRIYLRESGGDLVEDFVSIAGANHGSVLAGMVGEAGQAEFGYPAWEGAFEANPAYACDGESGANPTWREQHPSESTDDQVQFFLNGCLSEDGRTSDEDETPFDVDEGGHIRYLSVWNDQDDLVSPPQASCLNQAEQNDCSDPVNLRFSIAAMTELVPGSGIYSSHVETEFYEPSRQAVYDFITTPRE
jgi:pimeloyl-ACP methyl ester carboxylesterase